MRGRTALAAEAPDPDAPMVGWTNPVMEVVELPEYTSEHTHARPQRRGTSDREKRRGEGRMR
jgi:hypothetical protein